MLKKKFALSLFAVLLCCPSCDNKKIAQVVKEISEAPVDTQGFSKKTLTTASFSAIEIECFADITFHQSPAAPAPSIVIRAPREVLPNIIAEVENSRLKLRINSRYRLPEKSVVAVDAYAPYANRFVLNGGKCLRIGRLRQSTPLHIEVNGTVGAVTADTLDVPEMSLLLDGSGSIDLKGLNVPRLRANLNGSGEIFLSGKAGHASFNVAGDGKIHAKALKKL